MKCEYCDQEHNGTYGSGRFCSRGCANGFSTKAKRAEINRIVSIKLKGKKPPAGIGFKKGYDPRRHLFTTQEGRHALKLANEAKLLQIMVGDWDSLRLEQKKKRLWLEQGGKCAHCIMDEWLGKKLTLSYHHKDGNKRNNARNNVEYLCPNCHSMTDNYIYKNRHHTTDSKIKMSKAKLRAKQKTLKGEVAQ